MDSAFARTIEGWHDFYLMAGTAAATLTGLLFVAVSLHVDLLTDPVAAALLATARRAFSTFIVLVLVALVFLVPAQAPQGVGLPLIAFGLFDLARTVRLVGIVRRERTHLSDLLGSDTNLERLGLGLASSVGLLAVAITVLRGTTDDLYWLVGVIAVLLVGAALNCWNLLLGLAVAKRRRASPGMIAGAEVTAESVGD